MAQRRQRSPAVRWLSGLVVSVVAVMAVSGVVAVLEPLVPVQYLLVLYVLAVMPVAVLFGTWLAGITAVISAAVYDYLFVPPTLSFSVLDPENLVGSVVFLITAVTVGELASRLHRAALRAGRLGEEQSALRRIATLVARSAPQSQVFEAVTREVGMLSGADLTRMERYEQDGAVTGVAAWSRLPIQLSVGTRFSLAGPSIAREVWKTGGPARIESFAGATGAIGEEARELGIRSSVGCPIVVAGHLWGVIAASTRSDQPFPANTESQIASFTELVATAIANAQSRADLAASRARVVTAADETRKRLERNLHDGAQQRIVSLALKLRLTEDTVPADQTALRADLHQIADELTEVLEELRELSHGLHPPILAKGGLGPALRTLVRRSALPVDLHIDRESRYPPSLEASAYYAVAEGLTNIVKHANAAGVDVTVDEVDDVLRICIRDDGIGGTDPRHGSGLVGLRDRVEALGGSIEITSPAGQGTTIRVSLPIAR